MVWQRAIALIDMDAFFASIEQLDNPDLRGKPVAVTNGLQGSCIITCSYEARQFGIKTGMLLYEAKNRCPQLIQCGSRPDRYSLLSTRIMQALHDITPDIEIYSVDEAFLDLTRCQKIYSDLIATAKQIKQVVYQASQLTCSVGLSSNKTCAKYAAKLNKPNGFTVIRPDETKQALRDTPVTELCGINRGIAGFLAQYNVHFCGDIERIPISVLAKRFGHIGRRIWLMCQGEDPAPLQLEMPAPKSMGHGKVLPPGTRDHTMISAYLQHMSERLAARLRRNQLQARCYRIGLHVLPHGWVAYDHHTVQACDDGLLIFEGAKLALATLWHADFTVRQVQITALDPKPGNMQQDLFEVESSKRNDINNTVDAINQRYGELCCMPAKLMHRSKTPNVIAPAWKPKGCRKTV